MNAWPRSVAVMASRPSLDWLACIKKRGSLGADPFTGISNVEKLPAACKPARSYMALIRIEPRMRRDDMPSLVRIRNPRSAGE